jgi:hypothetical protein
VLFPSEYVKINPEVPSYAYGTPEYYAINAQMDSMGIDLEMLQMVGVKVLTDHKTGVMNVVLPT